MCATLCNNVGLSFLGDRRAWTYICPLSLGSMCVNIKAGVLPQRKKEKRHLAKVDARPRFFLTMVFAQKNFKFVEKHCRPKLGPRVHHDAFFFLSLFAGRGGQPISKVDNPLHITTKCRVPESGEYQSYYPATNKLVNPQISEYRGMSKKISDSGSRLDFGRNEPPNLQMALEYTGSKRTYF